MAERETPIVDRTLFSWIFAGNLKLQSLLLLVVLVAVIARVVPLEMQKRIINEAIRGKSTDLLITYCGIYLLAFVVASGSKFLTNVLQTVIGQKTLAQMRRQLYDHVLSLPMGFFRRTQPGLIVSSMVTELASAGDFVGMAVAIPLANLLTLVSFAVYLFWLNPLLAAVSFSIYPAVLFLIPKLQRRVNRYNRERVDATRSYSAKVGESIDGVHEIKVNAAFELERRRMATRIENLRRVRVRWNLFRFAVKVVNNLFTNLGRFLIFSLGGYLALIGRLELGALVAFLSAQEKLYDPWKELIQFYQAFQTASVTYQRTMDYYRMDTEPTLEPLTADRMRLEGRMAVDEMVFTTEGGKQLLQGTSFSLEPGEHMALVGGSGSGKSTLIQCLMGLTPFSSGRYELDGTPLSEIGRQNLSANLGAVFQTPAIFSGTIRDNLLYSFQAMLGAVGDANRERLPDLNEQIEMLQQTGLFVDVLGIGLNARLDAAAIRHLQDEVLGVRSDFQRKCAEKARDDIEVYDEKQYLYHSTIADNLLFGKPAAERFSDARLPHEPLFAEFLRRTDLTAPLIELGARVAERLVDIFGHLPILPPALPVSREEMDRLEETMAKARGRSLSKLPEKDRRRLLGLALRYIPAVHKLVDLPESLTRRIVVAREKLMKILQHEAENAICRYRWDAYIEGATLLENIVFGRITSDSSRLKERIHRTINGLLVRKELLEAVLDIGMEFDVGRGGENLSGGQRQKLALARAFLKTPPILLLDEATASLDNESQARVQEVLESRWKGRSTLVAVVHRLDIIKNYDKIAVMKAGRIEESGTYEELMQRKGQLYRLVRRS